MFGALYALIAFLIRMHKFFVNLLVFNHKEPPGQEQNLIQLVKIRIFGVLALYKLEILSFLLEFNVMEMKKVCQIAITKELINVHIKIMLLFHASIQIMLLLKKKIIIKILNKMMIKANQLKIIQHKIKVKIYIKQSWII